MIVVGGEQEMDLRPVLGQAERRPLQAGGGEEASLWIEMAEKDIVLIPGSRAHDDGLVPKREQGSRDCFLGRRDERKAGKENDGSGAVSRVLFAC